MRRPSFLTSVLAGTALAGAAVFAMSGGCDAPSTPTATPGSATAATSAVASPTDSDVLATVNGVPIRVTDLHFNLAREDRGRGRGAEEEKAKKMLDKIIEQELTRQRAEALGLDTTPDYLRKLRFMEAPLTDFKRAELGKAFYSTEIVARAKVDEAEARKHFEDNSARFKTEFHVAQILVKGDEAKIRAMKKELDEGAPFDEVAAKLFKPDMPKTAKNPWDMGLLRWNQLPGPWREVLEGMKDGEVSGILRGPNKRAWIIKLLKRQLNESITFEQLKPEMIEMLQGAKAAALNKKTKQELRDKATVVYLRDPGPMPPPPEPD